MFLTTLFQKTGNPPRGYLGVSALLVLLGYGPFLFFYGQGLWEREHYQFFPLAYAGAIYLARQRLATLDSGLSPAPVFAWVFVAAALISFLGASYLWSPWLGYISFLLLIVAVILAVGGGTFLRRLIPSLILLLITIRPPLTLDERLAFWLRDVTVWFSSYVLDVARVPHFLSGVIIEIPWDRLLVEEACSGVNSTFFVLGFALFYGLSKKRRPLHIGVVTLAALSFVILGNVFRITVGGTLKFRYGWNLLTGWPHETFGLVLFLAYIGLIVSADTLLQRLRRKLPEADRPIPPNPRLRKLLSDLVAKSAPAIGSRWALGLAIVFLMIGTAQALVVWNNQKKSSVLAPTFLKADAWFTLPETLAGWAKAPGSGPSSMEAQLEIVAIHSQVWSFRKGRVQCLVALSYPYQGWHDLNVCYNGHGWSLKPPVYSAEAGSTAKTLIEIEMLKAPISYGHLVYRAFGEDGKWIVPGTGKPVIDKGVYTPGKVTYQVQLFTMGYSPLTPEEREETMQLFRSAETLLREQVLKQLMKK